LNSSIDNHSRLSLSSSVYSGICSTSPAECAFDGEPLAVGAVLTYHQEPTAVIQVGCWRIDTATSYTNEW